MKRDSAADALDKITISQARDDSVGTGKVHQCDRTTG
jgi:hypothetical protein